MKQEITGKVISIEEPGRDETLLGKRVPLAERDDIREKWVMLVRSRWPVTLSEWCCFVLPWFETPGEHYVVLEDAEGIERGDTITVNAEVAIVSGTVILEAPYAIAETEAT